MLVCFSTFFPFSFVVLDLSLWPEEQVLNGGQPDMDDAAGCENQDEEVMAMVEETQSGYCFYSFLCAKLGKFLLEHGY